MDRASTSGFAPIIRALAVPTYGAYSAGNLVSLIGLWMQRVGVGWLTWELTESPTWLGAMAFADLFPSVFIAPLAGPLADRWDRLKLIKAGQVLASLQAALLALLTATGWINVEVLLALTLAGGIIAAFMMPVRLALIPSLVPRANMPAAVAINATVFNLSRFIGPALAGLVILHWGVQATFAANAISFLAFLVVLSRLNVRPEEGGGAKRGGSLWREAAEGFRYAAAHPGIAPILVLLVVTSLLARPVAELLPGFAAEIFHGGADILALLTSSAGIGATIGGLWLARRGDPAGLTNVALVSTLLLAAALLLFVASDTLWLAVPAIAVSGFCMILIAVGSQTLLQLSVDSALRGRVLSLFGMVIRGGPAVGALFIGAVSEVIGLQLAQGAGAVLMLGGLAWLWRRRRAIAAALEGGA